MAGISQRVVKGAALTSSVVLLDAGPAIRAVLVDVYRALGIDWRPETAGSLADVAPAPALDAVAAALAPGGRRARAASATRTCGSPPSSSRSTGRRLAACASRATSPPTCRR